ncbi:hypothetical protein [Paenibacillus albidus]|uniref:hypothetical protein n=1 Tax=Paenibacillus albidus TaxID=2041023 RepID=UPI001BEACD47|nr:hypothetical protein [Paenibacillus albidus]
MKANKGKVTAKILNDAGLKVYKGFLGFGGTKDGMTMAYSLSESGLTIQEAE